MSDAVRRTAVLAVGFVLYSEPEQVGPFFFGVFAVEPSGGEGKHNPTCEHSLLIPTGFNKFMKLMGFA